MKIILEQDYARLDRFLTERFPEIPRSQWDLWIRSGKVAVKGQAVTKSGTRLRAGDEVETEVPDITPPGLHLLPEDLDLPTLYEDDRIWILDKPAGVVVHPGPGHPTGTVANALLGRLQKEALALQETQAAEDDDEEAAPLWPGLVHRLDRFTTGCLVTAKDAQAQASIQAQFKARTVDKRYLALVRNSRRLPELGSFLIDEPIGRHRLERLKMCITTSGRPAQTRVKVLARVAGLALVECELLTGRTHQIRVHLGHLGAPILGDPLYGGPTRWQDEEKRAILCEHPMLHAWKLSLDHPGSGERVAVMAPLPPPFQTLLERLGIEI
ncbi:RluA family pseudouridine synthase [Holophaga foetida]|uniref:RluA family pseudouridine synthase n=1 Tax=Holophaga foetida TaxID=35839 RepID=UPI00024732D8|nr:RluA family pseudouridine synthase [Holophaga foetida]